MKKALILTLVIGLAASSWLALAREFRFSGPEKSTSLDDATLSIAGDNADAPEASDEDKKVLAELRSIFEMVNGKETIYMEGTLEIKDPSDSSGAANAHFNYYKEGQMVWFKNPDQEMVNNADCYAVADHELKRIVAGPARTLEQVEMVPLPSMGKNLKAEGYSIEKNTEGEKVTIRLISENHISCKEIRVEFDEKTKRPFLFHYRFADPDHLEENSFDKTMSVKIGKWETGVEARRPLPAIVQKGENRISAAKSFEAYEVIDLLNK
jgi:hypothetical protein